MLSRLLSLGTSVILLAVYGCYLFFQLKSHVEIYNAPSEKTEKRKRGRKEQGDASRNLASIGKSLAGMGGQNAHEATYAEPEEDEEEDEPQLHIWVAIFTLLAATALVAACAEFLVGAINSITVSGGISKTFVGLILLPIVGNAAEHATAVTVAVKDKMDLAIGVAVGSSMQIALLVLPLIVVLGWIIGKNDMVRSPTFTWLC
jgi:Ca2+:H+ antiporter